MQSTQNNLQGSSNPKLLCCKSNIKIGTFNIRTLKHISKRVELTKCMLDQKLNIVGLVDHKLVHDEPVETTEHENCVLITSSAWRNRAGAAVGGIGFATNKDTASALADTNVSMREYLLLTSLVIQPQPLLFIIHLRKVALMLRIITIN